MIDGGEGLIDGGIGDGLIRVEGGDSDLGAEGSTVAGQFDETGGSRRAAHERIT